MTKKNSVGILWMLLHGVVLTLMFALAKHLNKNIPVMQIIFIYNSIALLMLIAFFSIYGFAKVKTKKLKTHFLRSFLNITGYVAYFYGLSFMTLDAATSVTYLLPIIVSYLGTVFYKEKMTGVRIFALLCGFIGIIIILKPWTHGFEEGSVWVLLSVFLWSACDMITKTLGKTETVFNQAFYTILFGTLFSSTFAYDVWISEIYITEIFLLSYNWYFINFTSDDHFQSLPTYRFRGCNANGLF